MNRACIVKIWGLLIFLAIGFLFPGRAQAFVNEDRIELTKSLAHYTMGQVYDLLDLPERAALEYQAAAQYDETSYVIHLRLAVSYARLNMLADAKEELLLVQQYNPEELQSHYLLALIYSSQKDYDKAAQEYEHILKKFSKAEPQNVEIYGYLAQLYYSQRKYDQAIEQFKKMLSLDSENADVLYLLGSLYVEVHQEDQAIDLLTKSIAIDPNHDGSLNTLGYIYAERNERLDEALKLINRALDINPRNGAYLDSLGWIYYKKGMFDEALETLNRADSILEDPVIKEHLGDVYYKMNRKDEALKNWQISLELLPNQEQVIKKINDVKNTQASR